MSNRPKVILCVQISFVCEKIKFENLSISIKNCVSRKFLIIFHVYFFFFKSDFKLKNFIACRVFLILVSLGISQIEV